MYLGCKVKIPRDGGNITVKKLLTEHPMSILNEGVPILKRKSIAYRNGLASGNEIRNNRISCIRMKSF